MAAAAMKHMASNFAKLDKFEMVDFRRWQKTMHFLLSSTSVVYVLTNLIPEDGGDDATVEQIRKMVKWDNDDYVCRGLILNVLEQYNELFGILGRFTQHKMNMDEAIQVSCIIDKLPPSWKDFKHTLKHLKEELTLVELDNHQRIEESLRVQDSDKPKGNNVASPAVVNMVEHNNSFGYNDNKGNKKYCVTFIDDALRFCYVYLLRSKDEALDKFKVFKIEVELQQGSLIKIFRTDRGGLSQGLCGEAMLTACYLLKRVSNKRNMITPYELWTKRKPNLNYLRVWGCRALVKLPDLKLKTLGERGIECIFVGYAEHFNAFRFYIIEPNDSVLINSIIELMDDIFDENRFSSVPSSLRIPNRTEDIGGSVVPEEVIEEDVAIWKEAINDELDSIIGNNTWVLADLPSSCKPIGFKWIFKRKLKVYGTIEKFKARLVIQGFKPKSWIDYFDTYAPVARISTIRLLIVMASIHNLIIHQMDVKTTFLNG
nr:hypothetical protein [Tanacetum cinerariifolium]